MLALIGDSDRAPGEGLQASASSRPPLLRPKLHRPVRNSRAGTAPRLL